MKNILILSPDRPYDGMGGLGVHLCEVLKRFDTAKYNIAAICHDSKDYTLQDGKVKIYGINTGMPLDMDGDSVADTLMFQTRFVSRFSMLLEQGEIGKPDLVHICDWTTAVAGEEIARMTGAKIVFAVHLSINASVSEVSPLYELSLKTAQQIEWNICRRADKILHVSQMYAEQFPFAFYTHKTAVCHNGVDYQAFADADTAVALPGDKPVKIVFLGRIAEMKNPHSLWSIKIPENADLVFVGGTQGSSDMLIESLRTVAANNPQVHYMGAKYGQDKVDILASADLVVMPSTHEPFGMVALEALAAGQNGKTVLAASFVDGLGEFLTEESAINCGTTVTSIQAAVEQFLAMTEEQKTAMRSAGCTIARQYSWEACASKIQQAWDEVLDTEEQYANGTLGSDN